VAPDKAGETDGIRPEGEARSARRYFAVETRWRFMIQ
jgi:hypothetical protein